jgi:pimeloyl-ACP methyl ester carboxylesterase
MESAAKVGCPALFVLGGRDVMTLPRHAAALVNQIKNSRKVEIHAAGHSLMAEAPDATLDALIEFFLGGSQGARGGTA